MKRRAAVISLCLAMAMGITACGQSTDTAPKDDSSKAPVEDSADKSADKDSGKEESDKAEDKSDRTIVDQGGAKVELPEKVDRIADLWHANNQVVLLLGGADKLVVTTENIKGLPWFAKVYPRINEVPALVKGTEFNPEEIIAQNPDVALASNHEQIEQLRTAGVTAVEVMFQNFDEMKKTIEITGKVIGPEGEKRAQEYIEYLDGNIKLVKDRLKDLKDDEKPRVLHIAGGDNLTKIDGAESMIGAWMDVTGAKNSIPDEANLKQITLEEIINSDPDIIIIGGTQSQKGVDSIKNDPAWAIVKAVKDDKIIRNPVGTFNWDRYSAEEALQVLWAAKLFHPDKFEDIDMVKETKEFYKKFYNYDLTDEDANLILAGDPPAGNQ